MKKSERASCGLVGATIATLLVGELIPLEGNWILTRLPLLLAACILRLIVLCEIEHEGRSACRDMKRILLTTDFSNESKRAPGPDCASRRAHVRHAVMG